MTADASTSIRRNLAAVLRREARRYPVITLTGPRQSGKTTLCRQVFRGKPYLSFEALDVRDRARHDPRGLLAELPRGAVLDEIQHVPELLSYLQVEVDERPTAGRFVLTGSQQFGFSAAVAQTLAGRTAVLHLLPPSLDELRRFTKPPLSLWETLLTGAYPRIHDRHVPASRWLADYVATYVQRDVREVLAIGDLRTFTTFLRLCAGRTAQEVNLSSLGADVGVSYNTIRSWISVLEASYLCFLVPAWHRNQRKRWVKAPKLHWFDSGLACHLLGIHDAAQLKTHPLRGAIFESWVAAEIWKAHAHRGVTPDLVHFRQVRGSEVDLGITRGRAATLVEAKSGATLSDDAFAGIREIRQDLEESRDFDGLAAAVVFGGDASQRRSDAAVIPWTAIADRDWTSPPRG
jgi:predicted AAA+ superfamily ATPase